VSLRVSDLDSAALELTRTGVMIGALEQGAHERRAVIQDPSGNKLVLYQSTVTPVR